MNVRQSFFLFLFSFFILLSSCQRSTEPIYNPQNLQLKVLDVSCTEAWLGLQAKSDYLNKTLKLFKNDSLLLEKTLTSEDSLLYVDNLWPNTSYKFQVTIYDGPKLMARSAKVTATTMDTTSHDFTWQTYGFGGEGGSSSFYDVAIIDEDDIWAVGEIYTADDQYNAAHWDGEKWELKKIYFYLCPNDTYPTAYPIRAVFAFGKNDIWFARGGSLNHWNGSKFIHDCSVNKILTGSINKIWGTSDHDLYIVGNRGFIAHYDGQQWQRIESGTDVDLQDVWGTKNGKNIYSCGSYDTKPGTYLFFIENKKLKTVIDGTSKELSILNYELSGFFESGYSWDTISFFILSSSGVYRCSVNGKLLAKRKSFTEDYLPGFPTRIRGNGFNDFFIVGKKNMLAHFNGKNWCLFSKTSTCTDFYSLAQRKNIIVAVGRNCKQWGEGVLVMGRRW